MKTWTTNIEQPTQVDHQKEKSRILRKLKKDFPIGTKVFNTDLNKEGEVVGYDNTFAIPSVEVKVNFDDTEVIFCCTSSVLKKDY